MGGIGWGVRKENQNCKEGFYITLAFKHPHPSLFAFTFRLFCALSASGFFSVQSFQDGFVNNALGMVGLVTEGAKEDENFDHRMTEEER